VGLSQRRSRMIVSQVGGAEGVIARNESGFTNLSLTAIYPA
jgi:hypothetical protein